MFSLSMTFFLVHHVYVTMNAQNNVDVDNHQWLLTSTSISTCSCQYPYK